MAIELETITNVDQPPRTVGKFLDAEGDTAEIREVVGEAPGDAWLVICYGGSPPYLNRENAADLWPLLKRFAATGTLAAKE